MHSEWINRRIHDYVTESPENIKILNQHPANPNHSNSKSRTWIINIKSKDKGNFELKNLVMKEDGISSR